MSAETKGLERILLVEDDADIRAVVTLALERVGGFTVLACQSGAEMLETAEAFVPDLILMDVMMPGMDGLEAARQVRANSGLAATPLVFLTAKKLDPEDCPGPGGLAQGIIEKPFDPMGLAEKLSAIWRTCCEERE